jgi:hypothetical protein
MKTSNTNQNLKNYKKLKKANALRRFITSIKKVQNTINIRKD